MSGDASVLDVPGAPLPNSYTQAPVRFLPAFDNAVLGYDDRSRIINDEHRGLSVQGARFVLIDGRVGGVWTSSPADGDRVEVTVAPLRRISKTERTLVGDEAQRLSHFLADGWPGVVTLKYEFLLKDDQGNNEQASGGAAVRPKRRGRRRLRRAATAVVLLVALVRAADIQRFFFGRPGVGHFRSVEGRAAYVEAYQRGMSALPPPTATYDVVTDLGTVHAYEWSSPALTESVPVVLVPGRASGVPMWSENLPGFLKDHRVIAFDALGDAGLSVQSAPMESFGDQALWMEQVLAELAPSGAHLVGHSFGGATAATYAHRFPDRVVSLTLLEPVFTFANPPARLNRDPRATEPRPYNLSTTPSKPVTLLWDGRCSRPCRAYPTGCAMPPWARWAESSTTRTTTWRK
jgi:hypothetical protein